MYTDVIEPQMVGNVSVPSLRYITISDSYAESGRREFIKPYYFDTSRRYINESEIRLCNPEGVEVKFAKGIVNCALHFRRKRV